MSGKRRRQPAPDLSPKPLRVWHLSLVWYLTIIVGVLVTYANVLHAPFIYDDAVLSVTMRRFGGYGP